MELGQLSEQARMDALPHGWQYYTINQTLTLTNGVAFRPSEWKTHGTPIIRIQNLNDDNSPYNYYDGPISEKCRIRAGDILFAWSGTTGTSFGARIWTGPNAVLNQHIFKVTPDKTKVTPYYSFLVLQNVQKEIERQAHGFKSSFVHVKKSDLVKVCLPIPPIPEQRSIGKALSEVDQLIANLGRLLEKKQAIKQGMVQRLLTGRTRLPTFTDEWCEIALGDIAIIDPEALPSGTNPETLLDYISLEDVERGELLGHTQVRFTSAPSRARRVLRDSDVLFGTVRPNLQSHALYQGGLKRPIASTGFSIVRAVSGRSDPLFLFHLLMSHLTVRQVDRIIAGSNYPAVSSGDVRRLTFEVPTIVEQQAIGAKLADCDAELSLLKARLTKARDVKQGMMQQLLTGRTRLPVQESAA
ncbi:restriction endonuclease subunit S [Streptomyces scabiei]|uniref:restriction endonuclease subunit S n=1 Tax=Streptomyces scabiei TaxID=1930 RepID=UPI0038F64CDF